MTGRAHSFQHFCHRYFAERLSQAGRISLGTYQNSFVDNFTLRAIL